MGSYDFSKLGKSCSISIDGHTESFSQRADYLRWAKDAGYIGSWLDILREPVLAETIYRNWQCQGQLACRFAQRMASDPASFHLKTYIAHTTESGELLPSELEAISKAFKDACEDQDIEAITILFPVIESPESLLKLLHNLSKIPGWEIAGHLNPSDRFDRIYVGIHVSVSDSAFAEGLGFGPYEFLPFTRRSPIVALELRTKLEQPKKSSLPVQKPDRLHLAGIKLNWKPDAIERVLERTEKARRDYLGGDDSAAKAKVAFAIPADLWRQYFPL